MSPPSPRVTINDVARLAGVSKKTVSRVINRSPLLGAETRAKVETVIAQTGFVPNAQARALALRRNFLIALVHDDSEPGVLLAAQRGAGEALAATDFALAIKAVSPDGPGDLRRFLDRHRPMGVVLLPPLSQIEGLADLCAEAGVGCVPLGWAGGARAHHADERQAMADLVTRLVTAGHRRIGLVCGPDRHGTAQARELGYLDGLADHQLDRGPSLIAAGDMTCESGRQAGALLLSVSPAPTAIIACNDAMAAGVLQAAYQMNVAVPRHLSVIGCDDSLLARATAPPLAALHVPWDALARRAVRELAGLERAGETELPLSCRLVERASLAPGLARPSPTGFPSV